MPVIRGLQKTTLLDYPGQVAATVFTGGCNMRCPFCHNMNLVSSNELPEFSEEYILDFLAKRHGILDGVCITGGEPTLYPDLPDFISSIKEPVIGKRSLDIHGNIVDKLFIRKTPEHIGISTVSIKLNHITEFFDGGDKVRKIRV